ncbi:MAG TPA: DoxX family protein [Polyangia bacterium]|nr:DoxX family protein [Polyangia bacterium]
MKELFLLGRVLLGGYFLLSGSHHFTNLAAMTEAAAHQGVPAASVAVIVAGVLLIVGGVSLLLGLMPKLGVAAIALFLVPVTFMMHPFWHEEGTRRMMDFVNFTKNVGLLGAVVALVAVPEPWAYSVHMHHRLHPHVPTV